MPSAIHHHQALHVGSQVAAAGHSAWLDALPPWAQTPFFLTFAPCFVVLVLLMIRHRVNLHRRGERFTKSKTKPAEMIGMLLVMGAVFYLRDKYPIVRLVLEWPDRFAMWRDHSGAMLGGFFAAAFVARVISAMYAALFLRGGGGSRSGNGFAVGGAIGRHTLLPTPPDGLGWFSPATTRTRIITRRTFHTDEED